MITDPAEYFEKGCGRCSRFGRHDCSVRTWSDGLEALRAICLNAGLEEQAKWGHPCYMLDGRNIAIIGALRGDFRLTFFHAALMKDPNGVLQKAGPNTQIAGVLKFNGVVEVERHAAIISDYLQEAIGYAKAGVLPPKIAAEVVLPEELSHALDHDPELAEAFHRLTPGRQRSYVIHLSSAKASATKVRRIAAARGRILEGKGATER